MTTTTTTPTVGLPDFAQRNRVPIALGLAAVCVLLLVTWLGRDSGSVGGYLDPQSAGRGGARALAQVLGDHGEPVEIVRGRHALEEADVDARTTVVVSNAVDLGKRTFAEVDDRVRSTNGGVLVVIGISPSVADGLGLTANDFSTATEDETTPADCSPAEPLVDGLSLTSPGSGYGVPGDGCFGTSGGRLLLVDRGAHRWVLVDGSPMTNDQVDRGQNAAVGLRLLGQRDRVVWYVADPGDVLPGEGTGISRLLPRWIKPSIWLIGIAVVALMIQRGRRLGPLVTEPLPVTIRALESTTALGRLYAKARDRQHAAALLVDGTAARLGVLLGVAPTASRDELVQATGTRTGRGVDNVAALLSTNAHERVRSDTDLVRLAQELTQLEEEVRTV